MELVFYISSLVAVLSTLCVITYTQPIYALLCLIISLLANACIFFSLGASFAGALEIIVYAGAIMVLFVFVVMMLNVSTVCDKQEHTWLNSRAWIYPSSLMLILLMMLIYILYSAEHHDYIRKILVTEKVGIKLFGPYMLAVELSSILLLAGLIVSLHLGKSKRNNNNCP